VFPENSGNSVFKLPTKRGFIRLSVNSKRMLRGLLEIRKNVAHFLPFYHRFNAYLFNRRYKKGLAPWCEISDGLGNWLSKLREEAVALAPEGRIVEIGCGDGVLTSRLSKNSREVMGLDISMEAIKRAKEHESKNLTFSVHNIERDPLMGENSLIICEDVLYYVPFASMKKVARKLSEALINGGILLVIDYLPEDMETRYYYRLLSRFLTAIRVESVTYEPESARFMMAVYRRT
jgi:2-polyprenyl-3-methyl-5-hydroxy-6-metoxy-1,4-benzoquinol methylase